MDKDILVLLQLLSKKPYITLKEIETSFDITRRQAIYRIEKMNDVLKYKGIPSVLVGSAKEIKIDKKVKEKLECLLVELNSSDEYYMNKKERQIYMYLMLFINPDYLSLQNFISSSLLVLEKCLSRTRSPRLRLISSRFRLGGLK